MNVLLVMITVMNLPSVLTPREASIAPALLDMKETEPAAQVCYCLSSVDYSWA